jgi:hypothetical protein
MKFIGRFPKMFKIPNFVKKNPSSLSRVVPRGQGDRSMLPVAFRNVARGLKNTPWDKCIDFVYYTLLVRTATITLETVKRRKYKIPAITSN